MVAATVQEPPRISPRFSTTRLRRDQKTNYEDRGSSAPAESASAESDVERRLRQLAERQEDLAEQQRRLAAREPSPEEVGRQLERLTREQDQLRRQMADLQRELEQRRQTQMAQGQADTRAGGRANEQMRQALDELRRGELGQAARRAEEALVSLRELQREISQSQPRGQQAAVGQLRREAEDVAESQRQVATEARQFGTAGDESTRRRLAERETALAERVEALTERLDSTRSTIPEAERQPLDRAAETLDREDVAQAMRALAESLRSPGPVDASETRVDSDADADADADAAPPGVGEASDRLAEVMDRVADQLASADRGEVEGAEAPGAIEQAEALAERLAAIQQQLMEMAAARGDVAPTRPADETGESDSVGELAGLHAELGRQINENPELLEYLRRERPTVEQDLRDWAQHWQTGAAPGTEAFKRDLSEWTTLYTELRIALEAFELTRSRQAAEEAVRDRPRLGPTSRAPEPYRRLVDEYYRSLAAGQN